MISFSTYVALVCRSIRYGMLSSSDCHSFPCSSNFRRIDLFDLHGVVSLFSCSFSFSLSESISISFFVVCICISPGNLGTNLLSCFEFTRIIFVESDRICIVCSRWCVRMWILNILVLCLFVVIRCFGASNATYSFLFRVLSFSNFLR